MGVEAGGQGGGGAGGAAEAARRTAGAPPSTLRRHHATKLPPTHKQPSRRSNHPNSPSLVSPHPQAQPVPARARPRTARTRGPARRRQTWGEAGPCARCSARKTGAHSSGSGGGARTAGQSERRMTRTRPRPSRAAKRGGPNPLRPRCPEGGGGRGGIGRRLRAWSRKAPDPGPDPSARPAHPTPTCPSPAPLPPTCMTHPTVTRTGPPAGGRGRRRGPRSTSAGVAPPKACHPSAASSKSPLLPPAPNAAAMAMSSRISWLTLGKAVNGARHNGHSARAAPTSA